MQDGSTIITAEQAEEFRNAADPEYKAPIAGQLDVNGGEAPPPPVEELRVDGTTQLAIDAGGKAPLTVKLTLTGSVSVNGHFRKGDRITGTFEAVVDAYSTKDRVDKQTGIVTDAGATFGARVVDLTVE